VKRARLFSGPDSNAVRLLQMRILYSLILIFLNALPALAGNPVSVDQFKNAELSERRKMLEQAPPEQKEDLKKLDTHLTLVDILGGEERLQHEKENDAARARGFGSLQSLFLVQTQYWSDYITGVSVANEKAGMPREAREAAETKLRKGWDALVERQSTVHSLVFNLAVSPKALELARRVGDISENLVVSLRLFPSAGRYVTKQQIVKLDEEADQVYSELKKLPSLTPEQSRKELDSVSENTLLGRFSTVGRLRIPPTGSAAK
jgi:hypothetical protein